jgi:hypothetical protein
MTAGIGHGVFFGCDNIIFRFPEGNPVYEARENGKVLVKKETNQILFAPSLAGDVTLNGYTSIGNYAFWRNTRITSVKFGESFTNLQNLSFSYSYLTAVDIPSTITSLPNGIVSSMSRQVNADGLPFPPDEPPVKTLTLRANVVLTVSYTPFDQRVRTLYVPAHLIGAYQQAPQWRVHDIRAIAD